MHLVGGSDRQRFVFHIGLPKTGSTSIQHALVALSDDLRARGVHVPYDRGFYGRQFPKPGAPPGAPQNDGFAYFFDVQNRRPDLNVDWPQAVEDFLGDPQARAFVLSHENMSQAGDRLRREVLTPLADLADIRFVAYLRAPLSYLSSYCLQLVYSAAPAVPRPRMMPVSQYLRAGYCGQLAPFETYGRVDLRNFDQLRRQGRLVPDFFASLGVTDLDPQIDGLARQNTGDRRFNLACVFLALKRNGVPPARDWFALRRVLIRAAEDLEPPIATSFLSAALGAQISARWDQDRALLAQRYGAQFDAESGFNPGPEVLRFSADYGAALQAAAAPELSAPQKAWLADALTCADQNLDEVLAPDPSYKGTGHLPGQTKTVLKSKSSIKGDVVMSDETNAASEETKAKRKGKGKGKGVKIANKDAVALAKAMFRAQNRSGDADGAGDSGTESAAEKASFKGAKDEVLPVARRILKILNKQGYSLTKS